MSNYVTQMSKNGGAHFKIMDEEARAAIAEEESARETAISTETRVREEETTYLKNTISDNFNHSESSNSYALIPLFAGNESKLYDRYGWNINANPKLSQLLHKFSVTRTAFISRIEVFKYIVVACNITISLYYGEPKKRNLIATETVACPNASTNTTITLNVNNILVANAEYYLTIQADVDDAFDYVGISSTTELIQYGTYWTGYGTAGSSPRDLIDTYKESNWNGSIGFTAHIYEKEKFIDEHLLQKVDYYKMNSALENAPLGEVLPFIYKPATTEDTEGNMAKTGVLKYGAPYERITSGDGITARTRMLPASGYFSCVVRCECESDITFDFWRSETYNDGTSRTFIIDSNIPRNQDVKILTDLSNAAVYRNVKTIGFYFAGHSSENVPYKISLVKPAQWTQYAGVTSFGDLLGEWLSNLSASEDPSAQEIDRMKDIVIAPNMTRYVRQIDNNGSDVLIPVIPRKVMFVGNSLLLGYGFGMSASDSSKDYQALFMTKVNESLETPATIYLKHGGDWEGQTTIEGQNTWIQSNIPVNQIEQCDLIIVQLGDNVNTDAKRAVFKEGCTNFLKYLRSNAPQARVCWMGSWYAQSLMPIAKAACEATGSTFIDIRSLNTSENQGYLGQLVDRGEEQSYTYAVTDYTVNENHTITFSFSVNGIIYTATVEYTSYQYDNGNLTIVGGKFVVTNPGVASHPGDRGFRKIANKMLYRLAISDEEETYSIDP